MHMVVLAGALNAPALALQRGGWLLSLRRASRSEGPARHKDFSGVYEKMSGKGGSAREAHLLASRARGWLL